MAMTEEARELVELLRDEDNCNVLDYIDDAADLIESLSAQLDQVTRERDAAIRQQLEADKNNPFACNFCKHDEVCDGRLLACGDCDMDCPCNTCVDRDKWQWRGVEEEG